MDNIRSFYHVIDVREVTESIRNLYDKELLRKYIFEYRLTPWEEIDKETTNDLFNEVYNRGLYEAGKLLLKRMKTESPNISYDEAFEKHFEYYWRRFRVKSNHS